MYKQTFTFKIDPRAYSTSRRIFYITDEITVKTPAFCTDIVVKGKYNLGVNGPGTAYATFIFRGVELSKHFNERTAGRKARAWLDLMLNNCPDYCSG
jgi:hypothetical protein